MGEPVDTSSVEAILEEGRFDEALAAYRTLAKKNPQDRGCRAGIELCEGLKALVLRDRLEAAQRFEAALEPTRRMNAPPASSPICAARRRTSARASSRASWARRSRLHESDHRNRLGTTNSCVAVLDEKGQPKTLGAADGERTTPSWVGWAPDGTVSVGTRARRQAVTNASATVYGAKRLIGRKVNAEDVAWFAKLAPFRIARRPTAMRGFACRVSLSARRRSRRTSFAACVAWPRKR